MNNETPSPLISVVICTYNRCESLAVTLGALERMCISPELTWELLVVDNHSSDQTATTVRSFTKHGTALPLKYIFEPSPGLSHARNRGVRESQGTIIAFLDDDVIVSPEWLIEVRKAFQLYDPICIGGRVLLGEKRPRPTWWHHAYDGAVGEFDRGTSTIVYEQHDRGRIGIGANMIFMRVAFSGYGLFRTDMGKTPNQLNTGEETDLVERLRRGREMIVYYPGALVYHCPSAERFSKRYLRQHFYGLGWWSFLKELQEPNTTRRIRGIPRWRYRSFLANVCYTVLFGLQGRHTESFFHQLQCIILFGYFRAAHNARKGARETSSSLA
jgi:glycosyltransferase involved in cell wall biosynthesis